MNDYRPGTVLRHRTHNRYLRVLNPLWRIDGSVYVRNSDGAGFELDNKARWLTRRYFDRTYVLHYAPPERLNLAWFGVTQWCPVLGHTCDGVRGDCQCDCHRNHTSLRAVR